MGNFQVLSCCQDVRNINTELQIREKPQISKLDDQDYREYKREIDNINVLAEIDFNIREIQTSHSYFQAIRDRFGSVEEFIALVETAVDTPALTVVQSKAFYQKNNRYDQIDNRNLSYEHAIVNISEFATLYNNTYEINLQSIPKQALNKVRLLQRSVQITKKNYEQYVTEMYSNLMSVQGFKDIFWNFQIKKTVQDMTFHMWYNLGRYIYFLNSVISLTDTVSYLKIRQFYHFVSQFLCKRSLQDLKNLYFCETRVANSEAVLYRVGSGVVLLNFMPFCPYEERRETQDSGRNGMKQHQGDLDSEYRLIRFIVSPVSDGEEANKFRYFQNLFYLPFTLMQIKKIESSGSGDVVYLQQMKSQYLIKEIQQKNQLRTISSVKDANINRQDLLSQLIDLRSKVNKGLIAKYEYSQAELQHQNTVQSQSARKRSPRLQRISKNYYLSYLQKFEQNKMQIQKQSANLPVESKEQMRLAQEQIELKVEDATTERQGQIQKQSVVQTVEVSRQKLQQYEKTLARYIKKHNLQKLQSQIDNVDNFVNLISLNLSQSWLERIENMQMFPNLKQLYLYSNLLRKIQGLEGNANLRLLSLSRNYITKIENIEGLVHLRNLFITKNELGLDSAEQLNRLPLGKLQILSISFRTNPNECFQLLLKSIPVGLKKLSINQADNLSSRTKNNLRKKLKKTEIVFLDLKDEKIYSHQHRHLD